MEEAENILPKAEEHRTEWEEYVREVASVFHEREGEMYSRPEAISLITNEIDISERLASKTLSELISDIVDPVVQVPVDENKYIGVIEYHEFNGAYGYVQYDDALGEANRVVCAQCVLDQKTDQNVVNATSGRGSFGDNATFDELLDGIHQHYESSHNTKPENVKTGASLVSPTTIGSNTAFHAGNTHGNSAHSTDYTTLTEVNNNADVPNADFADVADSVSGDNVTSVNTETGDVTVEEPAFGSPSSVTPGSSFTVPTGMWFYTVEFDTTEVSSTSNESVEVNGVRVGRMSLFEDNGSERGTLVFMASGGDSVNINTGQDTSVVQITRTQIA